MSITRVQSANGGTHNAVSYYPANAVSYYPANGIFDRLRERRATKQAQKDRKTEARIRKKEGRALIREAKAAGLEAGSRPGIELLSEALETAQAFAPVRGGGEVPMSPEMMVRPNVAQGGIMEWIKANPIPTAAIVVGAVLVGRQVMGKGKKRRK